MMMTLDIHANFSLPKRETFKCRKINIVLVLRLPNIRHTYSITYKPAHPLKSAYSRYQRYTLQNTYKAETSSSSVWFIPPFLNYVLFRLST